MTTELPGTFVPETEQTYSSENAFAANPEDNDDSTETVMDGYPEYWIG